MKLYLFEPIAMLKRRELIQGLSTLPFVGSLMAIVPLTTAQASTPLKREPPRDLFKEFGVRTFINAAGTLTY
jgi:L-seryl-tRNA(Ser) seleniumtransferase